MKQQIRIKSATSTGKLKTVDIIADNVENVRSVILTVLFDPKLVQLKSARWAAKQSSGRLGYHANDQGQIKLSWFGYPAIDLVTGKPIIKLQFKRIAAGVCDLTFDDTTTDFGCRMFIDNKDFPDTVDTYKNGKITFK